MEAAPSTFAEELPRSSRRRTLSESLGIQEPASSVFRREEGGNDDEDFIWAALQRLSTYDRARRGVLNRVLDDGSVASSVVDITKLGMEDKKILIDRVLKISEGDNERLLQRLRARIDRVGIELPTVEVRFEGLSVEGDSYVGTRRLPTLLNATLNTMEGIFLLPTSKKKTVKMLSGVSGIIKPSRSISEGKCVVCHEASLCFFPLRDDTASWTSRIRKNNSLAGPCWKT